MSCESPVAEVRQRCRADTKALETSATGRPRLGVGVGVGVGVGLGLGLGLIDFGVELPVGMDQRSQVGSLMQNPRLFMSTGD